MISLAKLNSALQPKDLIVLPIDPVPASRKQVRGGFKYSEKHLAFQQQARAWLLPLHDQLLYPKGTYVHATVQFFCSVGPNSQADVPRADVDNLVKLTLDCLTDMKCLWEDDTQIVDLHISKRVARETPPGIIITTHAIPTNLL
jgi:Holliday junction resolvase RusA-like endonuclease